MEGERSSLFWEIHRLAQEVQPPFIFIENVPAIRTRGLAAVVESLAALRYDCRWGTLSAFDMGAPLARCNLWPTPTARDRVRSPEFREGRTLSPRELTGGLLNPEWVEWLMGYPIGWTELDALETPGCRRRRKRRSSD